MIFLLTFASLGTTGLLLLVHAACFAPMGEEDAEGFHFVDSANPKTTTADQHPAAQGGLSVVGR